MTTQKKTFFLETKMRLKLSDNHSKGNLRFNRGYDLPLSLILSQHKLPLAIIGRKAHGGDIKRRPNVLSPSYSVL